MPPSPTPPAGRASAAPELRRHLLRLVLGVVALDAAFLALKNRLAVDAWPEQRRLLFTGLWMLLTLAVVLPALAAIRNARQRARQTRAPDAGATPVRRP